MTQPRNPRPAAPAEPRPLADAVAVLREVAELDEHHNPARVARLARAFLAANPHL